MLLRTLCSSVLLLQVSLAQKKCKTLPADIPTSDWNTLNSTVNGRLLRGTPPAAVCHRTFESSSTYNQAQCNTVKQQWATQDFHFAHPVSILWDFWTNGTCSQNTGVDSPCSQGTYPRYVVSAQSVADVQAAVNFAREKGVRLVIKNTGHDFMGKSTGANSLSVWMRSFKEFQYYAQYSSPATSYTGPAVKLGAGWQVGALYDELERRGQTVVAGECAGVGFVGGYVQGGGHGPMSSLHGIGSDSVLEYQLVLANGTLVTANHAQNTDLFWALRGGGGAAFGVVVSATVKTHPSLRSSGLTLSVNSAGAGGADKFWRAISEFHANGEKWTAAGMFGYYELSGQSFSVAPLLAPGKTQSELQTLIQPYLNVLTQQGIRYTSQVREFNSFVPAYKALFAGEGAGSSMLTSSRLVLRRHVRENNAAVTSAFRNIVERGGRFIVGHMMTPPNTTESTSVNPIWRDALLLPLYNAFINADASESQKQQVIRDTIELYDKPLKQATPGSGTYLNEANIFDPEWRQDFYGTSYERLLQIKRAVDPNGIFWAKTAVGSELWAEATGGKLCET